MFRLSILAAVVVLTGCASLPPAPPPPPPPTAQFVVPEGSEFVSNLFGYSQAVRVGPWITVSAQPGYDVEKGGFPEALVEQAEMAFKNLATVLQATGATMNDVVSITSYQLDMEQFSEVVDARNEAFGEHRPTWTAMGVAALPLPAMQFQVSAMAYVAMPAVSSAAPLQPVTAKVTASVADAMPETAENKKTSSPFFNRPGY